MSNTAVIGMQWGDEGKGKIVDMLAEQHDFVVRFNGGANAGHTVKVGETVYKLHLLPSGVVFGRTCFIGNGTVNDPGTLVGELEQPGINRENVYISERAHLVMPQNLAFEAELEAARSKGKIGTTGRGIGTTYAVKALRSGFRFCDLIDNDGNVDKDAFLAKLDEDPLFEILDKTYGVRLSREETAEKYFTLGEKLKDRVCDTGSMIARMLDEGKRGLFEGAQANMLDIDHGTYPFVTSSTTTIGGVRSGTGVAVNPERVIGVIKAYTTRVGEGPFPTELKDEIGEAIRKNGGEYGTTTGRPRRCGWLDNVVARYANRINGITELAVIKLDVLSELPEIFVCDEYDKGGVAIKDSIPARLKDLARCKPVYTRFAGWDGDISGAKHMEDLPDEAMEYVHGMEGRIRHPATIVSVGPERNQTIYRPLGK